MVRHRGTLHLGALTALLLLASCERTVSHNPARVFQLGLNVDSRTGAVMVRRGDTLSEIAERYRLNIRDIIDYNSLAPPYHLAENQRLLLPAPAEHKIGVNDTLLRVSRMYDVSTSELVRLNRLSQPYTLHVGQVLRLPPSFERTQNAMAVVEGAGAADGVMPPQPTPAQKPKDDRQLTKAATKAAPGAVASVKPEAKPARALTQKVTGTGTPVFGWPVRGKIISAYGPKDGGLYNEGVNIAAAKGTAVKAAAHGTVVYVGDDLHSYGNMVLVRHNEGYVTAYAHLTKATVARGDTVNGGQVLGEVGNTGTVSQPQLHFEIRKGGQTLDPQRYIKG